ncbi:DNA-directed RNA polymerase subunit delta [Bacillus sp. CGMCC 1.16607]|uniref:DNA-directed RNA polymerase subunit delta n=1 Tax=Bacillus sp. CGMCC 1.16607 TaxID=3351842 RepID=UPI0036258563
MSLAQLTKEQLDDMSLIEMTYVILENNKQAIAFNEILNEIVAATGLTENEVKAKIAQFYTDLNIDGRFLCLGENRWGLRSWYPVDQAEEDTITQIKPKKKKAKKAKDDDDLEDYDELDEDEIDYDDEFEEDDLLDDEEDESFDDLDEAVDEFEDEELIDEEEELLDGLDDEELDDEEEDDLELEEEDEDL